MGLPILVEKDPATAACATCHGRCCIEHDVTLSGHDLWRIVRGLRVPWREVAELDHHRIALFEGFRLDRGAQHWFFRLRKRDDGACRFLVEVGDFRRCGIHALRPGACRVYPLTPSPSGAELGEHAICPDDRRAIYAAALAGFQPLLDEDAAERALYARLRARWDLTAMRIPVDNPLPPDAYVDWACAAYDAIEPLRLGDRADWQLSAYDLVDRLPLPR